MNKLHKITFGVLLLVNLGMMAFCTYEQLYLLAVFPFFMNVVYILVYMWIIRLSDKRVQLQKQLSDMYKKHYDEILITAKEIGKNADKIDANFLALKNQKSLEQKAFNKSISKKDRQLSDAQAAMQRALALFKDVPGALTVQSDGSYLPNPGFTYQALPKKNHSSVSGKSRKSLPAKKKSK